MGTGGGGGASVPPSSSPRCCRCSLSFIFFALLLLLLFSFFFLLPVVVAVVAALVAVVVVASFARSPPPPRSPVLRFRHAGCEGREGRRPLRRGEVRVHQVDVDARGQREREGLLSTALGRRGSGCCRRRRRLELLLLAPSPSSPPGARPRLGLPRRGVRSRQGRRGFVEGIPGPGQDGERDDGAVVGEGDEEVEEGGLLNEKRERELRSMSAKGANG